MAENVTSLGELFRDYETIGNVHIRRPLWQHKDMKLYQYLQVDHLCSLLETESLYVSNRALFPDFREQGIMENKKLMYGDFTTVAHNKAQEEQNKQWVRNRMEFRNLVSHCCVSCWTKGNVKQNDCDESILEWDHYGTGKAQYGKTCRMETTIEKIVNSIKSHSFPMWLSEVNYDKEWLIEDTERMIFWKYYAYEQEHEVRLCVDTTEQHVCLQINPQDFIDNICFSPYIDKKDAVNITNHLEKQYPWLIGKIHESHLLEKHN